MLRKVLPIIFLLATLLPARANSLETARMKFITDSLYKELAATKDPNQRVRISYDIFDIAPQDNVTAAGELVLEEALKAKDNASAMDMYRRLSSFNIARDTAKITEYLVDLRKLPKTPEREATECFVYLSAMTAKARYAKEDERYEQISDLIKRYRNSVTKDSPINDRVALLFTICNYLDAAMPGEVLNAYLTELDGLIKKMPYRLTGLENMYYLHSAMAYTYNGQPSRAIAADRELLNVIDRLDRERIEHGHKFRNYDRFRYSVYRRMLGNAEALSIAEVDEIYGKIQEIAARNALVAQDMQRQPRAEAYYLMAKGRYTQALPLLQESVKLEKQNDIRRQLLRLLVKAAEKTENEKVLMQALKEYDEALEITLRERTLQRGQELLALYNVADFRTEDSLLSNAEAAETIQTNRRLWIVVFVALFIITVTSVMFIILYRRSRKLSEKIQETNAKLTSERDNLRRIQASLIETRDKARVASRHKSDFISNMTHEVTTPLNALVECAHLIVDNVSSEKRPYLDRFARTIDVSADMLRTLINDVLEVDNLESGSMTLQRATVPLRTICTAAIESTRIYAKPGVELRWANENDCDEVIYTDPQRVEQVLVNLLINGLKFTEKGFVELDARVNIHEGTTTFTVTDTGIGVPQGKEEMIFNRFEKLSPLTQGSGLGLSICRMVAHLLNGQVYVDQTYTGAGARFVFTIPSMP
ncbi:MAG: ATP-binding protein [Firmicutes bacterium]|nr:ATP-binding protein [Bacillota bacterium]MCM1401069.1 ATP-binding protein [Bacteroides sp.]